LRRLTTELADIDNQLNEIDKRHAQWRSYYTTFL